MSIALEVGFAPPVLVDASPVTVPDDPELSSLLGEGKRYTSMWMIMAKSEFWWNFFRCLLGNRLFQLCNSWS